MSIESRIEKLEGRRPKSIDGKALLKRIVDAAEHARDEAEMERMMDSVIVEMTDAELAAAIATRPKEKQAR